MTLLDRMRTGLRRTAEQLGPRVQALLGASVGSSPGGLDAGIAEELEAVLLQADVSVAATARILARLQAVDAGVDRRDALKALLRTMLDIDGGSPVPPAPLEVVLVVGVNGTGKTTTVAKLAYRLRREGRRPLVCAADTFRAAAVEQLAIWTERAGVDMIRATPGADSAAVVFDAVAAGQARGHDVLIVDTAGRSHTRVGLMAELAKMRRIIARKVPGGPQQVLLVLDATVGQNGLSQARQFLESAGVTGLVLAKLDGTAKGGIAVAVAEDMKLPICYLGVGEGLDDLLAFSAEEYVEGLLAAGSAQ